MSVVATSRATVRAMKPLAAYHSAFAVR
jgi:hypothetical protein